MRDVRAGQLPWLDSEGSFWVLVGIAHGIGHQIAASGQLLFAKTSEAFRDTIPFDH
jgi:hypothetical protein